MAYSSAAQVRASGDSTNDYFDRLLSGEPMSEKDTADFYNYLRNLDPYAGRGYESSSILPWKRDAEEFNSRLDFNAKSADFQQNLARYFFEMNYNSEQNKVARMRAAGLNPDLQGIDSASTLQGEDAMGNEMPEHPSADPAQEMQQAAGLIFSGLSTAMSMAQQYMQLKGMRQGLQIGEQTIAAAEVKNTKDIYNFAQEYLANSPWFKEWLDSPDSNFKSSTYSAFLSGSESVSGGRYDKLVQDDLKRMFHGSPAAEKKFYSALTDVQNWTSTRAKAQGESNNLVDILSKYSGYRVNGDETEVDISKAIGAIEKAVSTAQKKIADYQADYYGNLKGDVIAGAENDFAVLSGTQYQTESAGELVMNEMISNLKKSWDEDHDIVSGFLLIIYKISSLFSGSFSFGKKDSKFRGSLGVN